MGIAAAFLCGLFYGSFFLAVHYKAEERKRLDRGIARLMADLWPSGEVCTCDECCGCGEPIVPGVTVPKVLGDDLDLSKVIRTGFEDG